MEDLKEVKDKERRSNKELQKRNGELWTYLSDMSGSKSQVDYILVNRKWKKVRRRDKFNKKGMERKVNKTLFSKLGF